MRKSRIALGITAVALLVVAGIVAYVLTNLNSIVEAAIERYGSRAAGTRVSVSSVDIRLSKAQATIKGLAVANPPGFSSPDAFKLGTVSARIDARSAGKKPFVIDTVRISGPAVFYEIDKSGVSNLDVLKKNLQGPQGTSEKNGERKAGPEKIRLYIRKLVFEKGSIDVRVAGHGDRHLTVNLPGIELSDIGRNGGATPEEVAVIVVRALTEKTATAVAKSQGEQYLRKGVERLLKRYLK